MAEDDSRTAGGTVLDPDGAPVAPTLCKLVVVGGPNQGLEVPVDGVVSVGTAADNDLVLSDEQVSSSHASFAHLAGSIMVKDEGSTNGTRLGGARITKAQVPLGSVIYLGGRTAIAILPRFHKSEVAPSAKRRFGELLGESVEMREVFAVLERAAPTDLSVLIEGETGTGKELAARSIHAASPRASKAYVTFNCGAIPRDLAESELFGHRKGAFSGAVSDRKGAFQRADGGTIFLDEVGELPLELQPKLLRVLETGEVRSVGDDVEKKVDVRVVAATNRELHDEVGRGAFRQDLLYRLDVVRVRIPPLRSRPQDVRPMVAQYLEGRIDPDEPIGGDNLRQLLGYAWPGNVRELRNILYRAVAMASSPGRLPRFSELVFNLASAPTAASTAGFSYPGVESPMSFHEAKEQVISGFERAYLEALLARHGGNRSRAAEAAGLSRRHLLELIRKHLGGEPSEGSEEG